ncbi:hypothetical protein [Erythrobacter aureus]|uniref:Uncharacterized protein n=1 Tax=Erythrobacter aureus TaxID=2182384 RepID=A0A345YIR2_9SPHN|nr:hypothetical protein [Erythrobacter aureus]AXK43814.1 hypothetical protein DVR09_15270 [Erythrobacter aureus]
MDSAQSPAPADVIAGAIRYQLDAFIAEGDVTCADEVGDGLCEEFAYAVLDRIHETHPEMSKLIAIGETDAWWLPVGDSSCEVFYADIPRLRAENAPLPCELDDERLAHIIGSATHTWLIHDGRHYDATAPEGADHFLLMPFFANQLAKAVQLRGEPQAHAKAD